MDKIQIGIIADDFTGALDAGAQFVGFGYQGDDTPWQVSLRLVGQPAGAVEIVNTASREIPVQDATSRNKAAGDTLAGRSLFKKLDSTLRGNIAEEIMAVMGSSGHQKAVICSAAPAQGRTIKSGRLFVNAVPLDETSFKDDPVHPARSSYLRDLINSPVTHIPLETVRAGYLGIKLAIEQSPLPLLTCDAETDQDLSLVGQAIIAAGALPCGAFGLAKAYIQNLPGIQKITSTTVEQKILPRSILVLVGSANQVSRQQVAEAKKSGLAEVVYLPSVPSISTVRPFIQSKTHPTLVLAGMAESTIRNSDWMQFGQTLSRLVVEHIDLFSPASLVVIGGETLAALCSFGKAESIDLTGELLPGVPQIRFVGGDLKGLLAVTKAGGFGDEHTLVKIIS